MINKRFEALRIGEVKSLLKNRKIFCCHSPADLMADGCCAQHRQHVAEQKS
jgi:hypothetical protein